MSIQELLQRLREDLEWAEVRKRELPIPLIDDLKEAIDWIEVLMTEDADVEPVRRGRWEQFRLDWDDLAIRLKCSCCCKVVYERGFQYCPNCGARMDASGNMGEPAPGG